MLHGHPDRLLYLDIKEVDLAQLSALVRDAQVHQQVIVASPDEATLRTWREFESQSQTLLWMGITRSGDEQTLRERLQSLCETNFQGITQLQIHVEAWRRDDGFEFKPMLGFLAEVAQLLSAREILFQACRGNVPIRKFTAD